MITTKVIMTTTMMTMIKQTTSTVFAGIDSNLDDQVEFGAFQKIGDLSTRRQSV